ncbi:DUF6920 family protein [Ectobacillus ponti]|uniref:DUF4131 domain-containing protein n=1 Tax=Ectobacillus ponti TaxID=2961894 RepID=A0AA41X798_9BACI|nr:DUF6544 family protein [Ectobacillus ponti]MCP8970127.1 hypothetical protein [Ectobacillus ponti]
MRFLIIVLLLLHSLAHLAALSQDMSTAAGVGWLMAALLFAGAAVLVFIRKAWWALGLPAVLVSQVLVILFWQDAKLGTVANLLIALAALLHWAQWRFQQETNREIQALLQADAGAEMIVTENMLQELPAPVQRWLQAIGLVGRRSIRSVHLRQHGWMKLKPEQKKWTEAVAEQYTTTAVPAFLWQARMKFLPFLHVSGRDLFQGGHGSMIIQLASLLPVARVSHNAKVDQSSLQRYLMELPWYPSAALQPYITWEGIDHTSAKATMTYNDVSGSATFLFSEAGELQEIHAWRYKDSDEQAVPMECVGAVREQKVMDGIRVPTKLDISWLLPQGPFTWYRLEISGLAYK